jgi:ribosomal protein S17
MLARNPMESENVGRTLVMAHSLSSIKICTGDKPEHTECMERLKTVQFPIIYIVNNPSG